MDKFEIKEFRSKHGLNQAELAEIVNVKVGTVQSWEQGKRNIGQSAIKLLHEFEEKQEKPSPGGARVEDLIAERVLDQLTPLLNEVNKKLDLIAEQTSHIIVDTDRIKEKINDAHKDIVKLK